MSSTPPHQANDDPLNESWVELYYGASSAAEHAAPPFTGNMHILEKLLLEAQRDSNVSSARGSGSPKSPHSPANETVPIIINKEEKQIPTDWIWDWSSRPDQQPPKDWNFRHPASLIGSRKRRVLSLRGSRIIRLADIFPLLLLSNILSVLLGAGIGVCIGRRMRVSNVE